MNLTDFDFSKDLYESINRIKSFQIEKAFKIIDDDKKIDLVCTIENNDSDDIFKCKLFLDSPITDHKEFKERIFNQNNQLILLEIGQQYVIDYSDIVSMSFRFKIPQIFKFDIKKIYSGILGDYNNKFHRLIIPIEQDFRFEIFSTKRVKIKDKIFFNGLIDLVINEYCIHIYKYQNSDSKESYLVIESLQKLDFTEFKKISDSFILSFAYLTGTIIQNKMFYQTSNEENFGTIEDIYYEKREKNVFKENYIINPSEVKRYFEKNNIYEKYKEFCHPLDSKILSQLIEKINTNSVYQRCCRLMVEANQNKQLLTKAGILSIALETLTTLISENNKDNIKPIKNKTNAIKLRKELLIKLEECKNLFDEESEESYKILTSKINEINRPTNSKKLAYPFELYGIKLNPVDIEILNHRNKFLHGTSPFDEDELQNKETELLVIIGHLTFMINSLILKYIGYRGHIVNNSAIVQFRKQIEITDHLFKII